MHTHIYNVFVHKISCLAPLVHKLPTTIKWNNTDFMSMSWHVKRKKHIMPQQKLQFLKIYYRTTYQLNTIVTASVNVI